MEAIPLLVLLGYIALGGITLVVLIYYIFKRIKEKSEETFEDRRS